MELRAGKHFSSMEEARFEIKNFVSKISINISYRIPTKKNFTEESVVIFVDIEVDFWTFQYLYKYKYHIN